MVNQGGGGRVYYRIADVATVNTNTVNTSTNAVGKYLTQIKDLDSFSFAQTKPTKEVIIKPKMQILGTKKKRYSKDFGYCSEDQFEEVLERLKLVRKKIVTRMKTDDQKGLNPDAIMPIEGLYQLCKKLPIHKRELTSENIKGVGAKQLKDYGFEFLDEI